MLDGCIFTVSPQAFTFTSIGLRPARWLPDQQFPFHPSFADRFSKTYQQRASSHLKLAACTDFKPLTDPTSPRSSDKCAGCPTSSSLTTNERATCALQNLRCTLYLDVIGYKIGHPCGGGSPRAFCEERFLRSACAGLLEQKLGFRISFKTLASGPGWSIEVAGFAIVAEEIVN